MDDTDVLDIDDEQAEVPRCRVCGKPVTYGRTGRTEQSDFTMKRHRCLICENRQLFAGWVYDPYRKKYVRARGAA